MGRASDQALEPIVELKLFGRFALCFREGAERVPLPHKAEQLLAYVALAPPGEHSRDEVAEALWSDAHGDLRKQFRQTLWIIGSALQQRHPGVHHVIHVDRGWVECSRTGIMSVDYWDLQRLAEPQHWDTRAAGSISSLKRAHAIDDLCHRRLLEGWSYPWVVEARDWARARHLEALETIVHSYQESSQHDRVLQYTARALHIDPSYERFHRERIRAYYELGDRAGAALAYRQCVDVLRSTYGLEPASETVEWGQRVLGRSTDS
jgi:DNA-binding SARP family transcriptional activator